MSKLKMRGVRKSFGALEVIKGVDLDIEPKEFVVFVGPSGCGKSTLLRMIAGLEGITSGDIEIDGQRVNDIDPSRRGIAMVFQTYALYPHMTVRENMGFALRFARVPKPEIAKQVAEAARILELGPLMERRPKELSGGQRQRVAIGRAIVRNPNVFLFDEPLSNLDAELRVQMRVEIARLHRELGTTMIYVTHDQVEAMTLADRIVILRDGNIEQIGKPLDLYDDPSNQFVAGFIGSPKMNFLAARVVERNAKRAVVQFAGGAQTRLAQPLTGQVPELDSKVVVGVRPEHFGKAGEGDADFKVKVDVVEHLGGTSFLYGNSDTGDDLVIQRDAAEVDGLEQIAVSIRRSYLFDERGQRLR